MENAFFKAVLAEEAPMYDAALVSADGIEYWHSPVANNANNSHSATKFFVATAIGICRDRGLLSLDTKITSVFDPAELPANMDAGWHEVTVRDTLMHRTGMERIPYGIDEDNDIDKIGPDFLKYIFSLEIMHKPGEFRHYSDAAYYLLSRVVAKVTGMTADKFMKENIMDPLGFRQWAMAMCPMGHPVSGGGFYTRADDMAKLGYAFACGGVYNGHRIVSEEWTQLVQHNDYACGEHRDTGVFLKTGARGQLIGFSPKHKIGVAWHGCAAPDDQVKRNDRLLAGFVAYLEEKEASGN